MVSASSSQVNLHMWVCMGDVQHDELIAVLPVRSVPKISTPHDDVYPQVPVWHQLFPALNLVNNSKPL